MRVNRPVLVVIDEAAALFSATTSHRVCSNTAAATSDFQALLRAAVTSRPADRRAAWHSCPVTTQA